MLIVTRAISAARARQTLASLLRKVQAQGERIVVEQSGHPMAVIVPIEFYESWEKRRAELFGMIDEVRVRNRRVNPAFVVREVAAAQRAVRRRTR